MTTTRTGGMSPDFVKFWTGQTISNLGSAFTAFALPLLIYKLTGSALNLGITTAATFMPYLLFGLIIGAWVDRVDRKQLMIWTDIVRGALIAVIPLLASVHHLSVWAIYVLAFVESTLSIVFNSAEFAAIPSLTDTDNLVEANGRIQASYQAGSVVGPLLAGAMVAIMPLQEVLLVDSFSFVVSAVSLALVRTSFNLATEGERPATNILQDVAEGLRYVLGHPVLRNISMMMALVNLVGTTTQTQLVLFAKHRFAATDPQVALLFSAGSVGMVIFSLAAGRLRARWSFSRVALSCLMASGLLTVAFAATPWYWPAVVLWTVLSGAGLLFNINTGSLRQAIVPNHMLGRVMSIAGVLAWSAIPVGTVTGGVIIQRLGHVEVVYGAIGVLTFLIPLAFSFTALGHAERYLPETPAAGEEEATA